MNSAKIYQLSLIPNDNSWWFSNCWENFSFTTGKFLSSAYQATGMSETDIETLKLVVWNHRFGSSVFAFLSKAMYQAGVMSCKSKSSEFSVEIVEKTL